MSPIFKSGAFLQQCFSVHPLCLSVKKITEPEYIILSCSSCNMTHRLTVRSLIHVPPSMESVDEERRTGWEPLASCVKDHPMAVQVSAMDVLQDAVELRCRDCRRTFDVDVSRLETHQR